MRQKAVGVALAITSGAYQTSLLTYLIQRDMFPAVMKVCIAFGNPAQGRTFVVLTQRQLIQDAESTPELLEPFTLLGLLANYNKFEFQNPYQLRLNDFVNEATIQKIIKTVGYTCQNLRAQFVDIQDDLPEGWTLSNTLNMLGLGKIAPGPKPEKKPIYDADTAKKLFAEL